MAWDKFYLFEQAKGLLGIHDSNLATGDELAICNALRYKLTKRELQVLVKLLNRVIKLEVRK